jgi:hypothetical protein
MGESASGRGGGDARADTRRVGLAAAGALALAVVLWGGYSHRWPWTGINGGTATLWDWLHLLLLPLAVVVLPVWMRSDTRLGSRTKSRSATAMGAFVVLVILGYTVPWGWTGFRGNTVWDWLKLVVLPLTVVLVPRIAELRRHWSSRHTIHTLVAAALFVAVVAGGYLGHWSWTGFTGNTLWDWLNLLFLPVLLPTVIVPALTPKVMGEVIYLDADGRPIEADVVEEVVAEPPEGAAPEGSAPETPLPDRDAPSSSPAPERTRDAQVAADMLSRRPRTP